MADEVIRFNGFPFLEKEDKEGDDDAFIEPSKSSSTLCRQCAYGVVAHVMKQDLTFMKASGMPLQEISKRALLTSTPPSHSLRF